MLLSSLSSRTNKVVMSAVCCSRQMRRSCGWRRSSALRARQLSVGTRSGRAGSHAWTARCRAGSRLTSTTAATSRRVKPASGLVCATSLAPACPQTLQQATPRPQPPPEQSPTKAPRYQPDARPLRRTGLWMAWWLDGLSCLCAKELFF